MKKGIFAIFTVLAILAMVMTGCPDGNTGGGGDDNVNITFDVNGGPGTAPAKAVIKKGTALGDKLPADMAAGTKDGKNYSFNGWFTAKTAGTKVSKTAPTFDKDTPLYAQWTAVTPAPEGKINLIYNLNWPTGVAPTIAAKQIDKSQPIGTANFVTPSGAQIPTGYTFKEWNSTSTGNGTVYTATSPNVPATDLTLYAQWTTDEVPVEPDVEIIEKITLGNSWYAIYVFNLPTGEVYENYSNISVDYMLEADELVTATSRNARLMGNYKVADFSFLTGTSDEDTVKNRAVANYNAGKNNPYILDKGKLSNSGTAGSLATQLDSELKITAVGGEWFTIDYYDLSGGRQNGSDGATNKPIATATGPFFFGIGLPGAGAADYNTFYVKNVKMKGVDGTKDVVGTPLWFMRDKDEAGADILWPAFCGYPSVGGGDGFKGATREVIDGPQPVPVDANPTPITVTFNLNYQGANPATIVKNGKTNTALGTDFPDDPTRTGGFGFVKWTADQAGTGATITSATTWEANANVYAQWAELVTITLNENYGDNPATTNFTVAKGAQFGSSLTSPTRTGYVFLSWNKAANGSGDKVTATSTSDANLTVYAQWVQKATSDNELTDQDLYDVLWAPWGNVNGNFVLTDNVLKAKGNPSNGMLAIKFPSDWQSYEKVIVDYTIDFTDSTLGTGSLAKFTLKAGNGYYQDNASSSPYKDISASGSWTLLTATDFPAAAMNRPVVDSGDETGRGGPGLSMQTNPATAVDGYTFTITKVTFKKYE